MFIRVLPKAWCRGSCQQPDITHEKAFATQRTGQSTLSAIPTVFERYVTGRVRASTNPYWVRRVIKNMQKLRFSPYCGIFPTGLTFENVRL